MRPRLVLFGDSITEQSFASGGWGAALADHFARKADVVLRGLSGYNTRWALKVLDRAMEGAAAGGAADPAAVTVFFGANDASLPDQTQAHQHVPLAEYQDNLRAICAYFKNKWPSAAIILITPPPIHEPARIRRSQSSCSTRARQVAAVKEVCTVRRRGGDDGQGKAKQLKETAVITSANCFRFRNTHGGHQDLPESSMEDLAKRTWMYFRS